MGSREPRKPDLIFRQLTVVGVNPVPRELADSQEKNDDPFRRLGPKSLPLSLPPNAAALVLRFKSVDFW